LWRRRETRQPARHAAKDERGSIAGCGGLLIAQTSLGERGFQEPELIKFHNLMARALSYKRFGSLSGLLAQQMIRVSQ
jgi:hypothetical protein